MLHGKWVLTERRSGATQVREDRNTETVRLRPEGGWKFVIDHSNAPD